VLALKNEVELWFMRRDKLVVHLSGGLGNQLFQYMAGLSIAQSTNRKLCINGNLYKNPTIRNHNHVAYKTKRKLEVTNFLEISRVEIDKSLTPRDGRFERILNQFSEKEKRRFGIATEQSFQNGVWNQPQDIRRLVGYFMSPDFFEGVSTYARFGKLVSPFNEWTSGFIHTIKNQFSIGVHVRLTDYLFQNVIDTPSEKYYLEAIKVLKEKFGNDSKVFLFTDDPAALNVNFPELFQKGECVVPPPQVSVAENLVLYSKCSAFVCSNSTYSWWGARISEVSNSRIIHPSKHFKTDDKSTLQLNLWPLDSVQLDPETGVKVPKPIIC
jgi:hypothetical protein